MRYETVELADAVEGDEVYQAGKWSPVEGVYVFGSRRDLVKIVWQGGGSHSGPLSHMGKARRPVVELVPVAADLVRVSRLHGADIASYLADAYPATLPLVAIGWTTDAAIAHVEGVCDRAICTGDHA